MHAPYDTILGHPADFKVRYRFLDKAEGGRLFRPFQGYRSDFYYEHEENRNPNNVYMIRPEFEDENGDVILNTSQKIGATGTARMWIISPAMRSYHKNKIILGLTGHFREGGIIVAESEVIEIVGLLTNPRERLIRNGKEYL